MVSRGVTETRGVDQRHDEVDRDGRGEVEREPGAEVLVRDHLQVGLDDPRVAARGEVSREELWAPSVSSVAVCVIRVTI